MELTTCLWFDGNALDAAKHYVSTFPNATLGMTVPYDPSNEHGNPGSVMTVEFSILGQKFLGLNGGPQFPHSCAVSFVIPCETQEEMDHYYEKLSAVPEAEQCWWVCDQFGISWQIIPNRFLELMKSGEKEKSGNLMKKMMQMKRLNITDIEKAYNE